MLMDEQMTQIMNHHLKFNGSYTSMENMARIVNSTPNSCIKVPSTKPNLSSEIHIKCSNCVNYLPSNKSESRCENCDTVIRTSTSDYFIYIPIIQQLMLSIDRNFDEIMHYASSVVLNEGITDLHNAEIFKNAQKKYPNSILLPLILNTDGVKVFKSSHKPLKLSYHLP